MVATHNIKVDGVWIKAGETYGEPAPEKAEDVKPEAEPEEEAVQEPKPKSASRRRVSK